METLIHIVILVCLFVIILLLLVDKVKIIKAPKPQEPLNSESLPNIMGKPLLIQKTKPADPIKYRKMVEDRLKTTETAAEALASNAFEPSENWGAVPMDWSDDDTEDESQPEDDRFSQGVSLEELMKVGDLLKQEHLSEAQEEQTAEIAQKIYGTEFFEAMQSSIQGVSQKIARLLDQSLPQNEPSDLQGTDREDDQFDIRDFI